MANHRKDPECDGSEEGTATSAETRDPCDACKGKYRVAMAIFVRLMLLIHSCMAVWLVVSMLSNTLLWSLMGINILMLVEAAFTLVKRGGRESKWICTCFVAYLAAVLPPIWLVELDRLQRFNDALGMSGNLTSLTEVNGLTVPIRLEPQVWVSVMEQTLLFLLVLCRWLLPRGDITRHELSQLLFVFLGIASDNMELFQLFDETQVRKDTMLTYVVLGVWSLSLLQFIFVLTATRNTLKLQQVRDIHPEGSDTNGRDSRSSKARRNRKKKQNMCEVIFTTEIWSLLFSVMVQDGPYAATRIYTVVKYDLLTYSIIFFICKNLLVISLVFYRLTIICVDRFTKDDDDGSDDEDNMSTVSENRVGREKNRSETLLSNSAKGSKIKPMPMTIFSANSGDSQS